MNAPLDQIVFAIQSATQDLIDLALSAAPAASPSEVEAIESEIHSTMLALMAAAILSHGPFSAGKQAFLQVILNRPNDSITTERVVNEYGSRWSSLSRQMPDFLKRAVVAELRTGGGTARAMLVLIQIIGNNAAIADGDFVPRENLLVRNYLAQLETHIDNLKYPPG